MTAKNFKLELNKEILDTEEKIDDAIDLIAMFGLRGVVKKTPVDTGRLRGNWIVSKNSMNNSKTNMLDKQGTKTIRNGSRVIDKFNYKSDSEIIIQNNLDYAERIENGGSRIKAPKGMISVTIAEMNVRYRNITI